jgi:hypothetical protein
VPQSASIGGSAAISPIIHDEKENFSRRVRT